MPSPTVEWRLDNVEEIVGFVAIEPDLLELPAGLELTLVSTTKRRGLPRISRITPTTATSP